jgi:integrase
MRHKRTGGRVYGPYANRRGFRLVVISAAGTRRSEIVATRTAADQLKLDIEAELQAEAVTVNDALDDYRSYMRDKGNRPRSIETTLTRLRAFFPDGDLVLADLTAKRAAGLYTDLRTRPSKRLKRPAAVDSHRNTLNQARTFARWCGKRGWIAGDPLGGIEGVGRRRRGKPQLRLDEGRVFLASADLSDPGNLAAGIALLLGLRATEIASIAARDVDDKGALLWIPESKTDAGRRMLEVPDLLRGPLEAAKRAAGNGRLFPGRNRHWVLREVQRLCRAAGVPVVSAHGLRGTHATVAQDMGATGRIVAAALGHTSEAVTAAHYTKPDAADRGRARRAALRLVP